MGIIQSSALSITASRNLPELPVIDMRTKDIIAAYQKIRRAQEEVGGECVIRVKIPAGGAKHFIVAIDPDEENPVPEIDGVIFYNHECNARFDTASRGSPPICSSPDGATGFDSETGDELDCEACHLNRYGSAMKDGKKSRGKACKNMRRIYILVDGCHIPLLLTLPPTSLTSYQQYRMQTLAFRGLDPERVVTKMRLEKMESKDGDAYSVVRFKLVGTITDDMKAVVDVFSQAFRPAVEVTQEDYSISDGVSVSE